MDSKPIVEIAPTKNIQSSMILHEDSSFTENNDGVSNVAILDGNSKPDTALFKFKKVKGFKHKTQTL